MLSWAQRRKLIFTGGAVLLALLIFGVYGLVVFFDAPDCANGTKDGDERGTDCGGSCVRICRVDTVPPVVHFARTLQITEGVWGAVAYLENRNAGAGARFVPYRFKLYDEENLLLYERRGEAFIPPRKVFALFEGQMKTGNRIPSRATFEFLEEPVFVRMAEPDLTLVTKGFSAGPNGSLLEATLTNPTRAPVEGIEATALLFSGDGNVIATSATVVKRLPGGGSTMLAFTWPTELETPSRIEVLYTVPGRN